MDFRLCRNTFCPSQEVCRNGISRLWSERFNRKSFWIYHQFNWSIILHRPLNTFRLFEFFFFFKSYFHLLWLLPVNRALSKFEFSLNKQIFFLYKKIKRKWKFYKIFCQKLFLSLIVTQSLSKATICKCLTFFIYSDRVPSTDRNAYDTLFN